MLPFCQYKREMGGESVRERERRRRRVSEEGKAWVPNGAGRMAVYRQYSETKVRNTPGSKIVVNNTNTPSRTRVNWA